MAVTPTTSTIASQSDIINNIITSIEALKKTASISDLPFFNSLESGFKSLLSGTTSAGSAFKSFVGNAQDVGGAVSKIGTGFKAAALGVGDLAGSLVSAEISTNSFMKEFEKVKTLRDIPGIQGTIGKFVDLKFFDKIIQTYTSAADVALKLQRRTLDLGASVGGLNAVFASGKIDIDNVNNVSEKMGLFQAQLIKTLHLSAAESATFFEGFMKIPGAFEKFVKGGAEAVELTKKMQSAYLMASAAGIDHTQMLTMMKDASEDLGLTVDQSIDYFARFTQLTRLGAPMEMVKGYIEGVTQSLSKWGNTTEGTTKIFANLYPEFRKVGVSAKDASEIIGNMARSVGNLSVAQEALISSRTGGPGGLMGAYQIEEMVASGDTAGVLKKMQDALREQMGAMGMGGKIVTRGEAAKSQEAAAQYTAQMQLMQSGIFGDYGRNKDTANKILEVMAQGGDVTEDKLGDVKEAIQNSSKDGEELQKQTNLGISELLGYAEEQAINTAYSAYHDMIELSERSKPDGLLELFRQQSKTKAEDIASTGPSSAYKEAPGQENKMKALMDALKKGLEEKFKKTKKTEEDFESPTDDEMEKTRGEELARKGAKVASAGSPKGSAKKEDEEDAAAARKTAIIPISGNKPFQISINLPACPHCGKSSAPENVVVPIPS